VPVRHLDLASRPVPAGIDVSKPNIARVYDALLGWKDNFAVACRIARTSALCATTTVRLERVAAISISAPADVRGGQLAAIMFHLPHGDCPLPGVAAPLE
jgi:hypothetical protein